MIKVASYQQLNISKSKTSRLQTATVSYLESGGLLRQKVSVVLAATKPYKSDLLTKLAHFIQLMPLPWKIVTTSGLNGVAATIDSYPEPGGFLRQKVSVLAGKTFASCANHIFLPVILKNQTEIWG